MIQMQCFCDVLYRRSQRNEYVHLAVHVLYVSQLGAKAEACHVHTDFICESLITIMRHHTLLHLLLSCTIICAIVWYIVPYVMIKGARLDKVEMFFPCSLEKGVEERERILRNEKHGSAGRCCHDFWELSAVPS